MPQPPSRFQITPVLTDATGKETIASNAIAVGSMSAVDEFRNTLTAPDQIKSLKQKLATAEADAATKLATASASAAKWKKIAEDAAAALRQVNDGMTELGTRMDQFEEQHKPKKEAAVFPPGYQPEVDYVAARTADQEEYQPQQAFPGGDLHVVEAKHDQPRSPADGDDPDVLPRYPQPRPTDPEHEIGSKAGEPNLTTLTKTPPGPAEKDKH